MQYGRFICNTASLSHLHRNRTTPTFPKYNYSSHTKGIDNITIQSQITLLQTISAATIPSTLSNALVAKALPAALGFAVIGVGVPAVLLLVGEEAAGMLFVGALDWREYGIVNDLVGSRRVAL